MNDSPPHETIDIPTDMPAKIGPRYLLLQGPTPVYIDRAGRQWLERLWAIDAGEHLSYIAHFSVACPVIEIDAATADMVPIDADAALSQIRFVLLPHSTSRLRALAQMPLTVARLWSAIGQAEVVHLGVAGWPYPLGWLGLPIARILRKKTIVVVESAPWRAAAGAKLSRSQRLQGKVYEALARWVVQSSDLRFFTTDKYRKSMCGGEAAPAHVVEATWIPQDQVITARQLDDLLRQRTPDASAPLRVAFFGRLLVDKGVLFLLEAMRDLPSPGAITLDIYGEGPQLEEMRATIAASPRLDPVRLRGTLTYGPELFARLRDYDYVVVPSFGDEQPRIVYDAFSQGVPVLASDTDGLRQCVDEGATGWFFQPGSSASFGAVMARMASAAGRHERSRLARNAAAVAARMTHAAMHQRRARLIGDFLRAA